MHASRRRGNLPGETTPLVGRLTEVAAVEKLLGRSRLVTLTGAGGAGKTRVALRAAAELRDTGGAWLVPAPQEAGALPYAIASALFPAASAGTTIEGLARRLAEREALLVLDGGDHLMEACAAVVTALLAAAPGLRVLATCRRPLRCRGERVLPVPPLPLEEARVLFAERAVAAVPGCAVAGLDEQAVLRVCRRLEGLPLAVELAAARLRELPVEVLARRLDDHFSASDHHAYDGSSGGRQVLEQPGEHALRATIAWTHRLCTTAERLLWARASVFTGSFDAVAAKEVCGDDRLPTWQLPQLLESLADRAILVREPGERYRMPEPIHAFGAERLKDLGQDERLRRRREALTLTDGAAG
ncbi:AAA family ATPase [Nonomuraea salmonea]|uniref:AAA family ATPase n=1 Tax=Nonomuraea salmonea TaxID=46181 RepID=A0ABV5NNT2_9ACTN